MPRFHYPGAVEDVQRAIRFVRHHAKDYGIDPARIGGMGGSSGGHLIALTALLAAPGIADDPDPVNREPATLQAIVLRATPTDLIAQAKADRGGGVTGFLELPWPADAAGVRQNPRTEKRYRGSLALDLRVAEGAADPADPRRCRRVGPVRGVGGDGGGVEGGGRPDRPGPGPRAAPTAPISGPAPKRRGPTGRTSWERRSAGTTRT